MGSGGLEFGTVAMFIDPLGNPAGAEYGPDIPGPEIKNPKTSAGNSNE